MSACFGIRHAIDMLPLPLPLNIHTRHANMLLPRDMSPRHAMLLLRCCHAAALKSKEVATLD